MTGVVSDAFCYNSGPVDVFWSFRGNRLRNKFAADSFKAVSSNTLAADHCIHQQQLSLLMTDLIFRSNQDCSGQAHSSTPIKFAADG
ncbi:hypothetical protein L1987_33025 [Smallanthus sonchifolius]|uniref:Uncharacterized protein n=1 Tax=Smallanthus sonchifolius TaxID=185202 RepID=A0ACB9HQ76_9ASTR|nr:hypothetical protein L1987_33025 [Smallanthus sonchifolius]